MKPWHVALAACLLQLPLVFAPGYFSHDELQWAVWARTVRHVPWWDVAAFQYRPLTFNLWMMLSRVLFAHPHAYHALFAAWGALHATVLCALSRRAGLAPWPSAVAGILFVSNPYAVAVHGWVATLGDLVWTACALALAAVVLQEPRARGVAVAACVLTGVALLAKESAVVIPLLCAVAACVDALRRRRWLGALLGSATAVVAYLALRLPALLHAPREARYVPSLVHLPVRWLEYQLFPPLVPLPEVQAMMSRSVAVLIVAALLWCAVLVAFALARRRLALLWLVTGSVALGPVLVLGEGANQYGYAFAMTGSVCMAAALASTTRRVPRAILMLAALLTMAHGAAVMAHVLRVARVQAVFSPALAEALRTRPDVRLRLAPRTRDWMILRFTHDIPAYADVPIGPRVRLVADGEPADFVVEPDGRLRATGE